MGFKYKGVYYCLTHSPSSVLVPKKCLRMNNDGDQSEYIALARSVPTVVNLTNMRLSKLFFYNTFIKEKEKS